MRPTRLELKGFSAFREQTIVDFTDADLFAFVGPTGSGKSSIIDAITFALYGSVSRYDDERLVAPIIHQLETEARIQLDFEVGGEPHTAVRIVRRTQNGATTKEARLERGDVVLAGTATEMVPAVQRVVGLDFGQFTKTVVLPQGDFAAFLHEKKSDRQKLLRQLLDLGIYERMGKRARERATAAGYQLDAAGDELNRLAVFTASDITDLKRRIKLLAKVRAEASKHLRSLAALGDELGAVNLAQVGLKKQIALLAKISVPKDVGHLTADIERATAAVTQARARLDAARVTRKTAKVAAEAGPDAVALGVAIKALERRDRLTAEIKALADEINSARLDIRPLESADSAARSALEETEHGLTLAKEAAGAKALVASLAIGDPCPVCLQVVHDLPQHDLDGDLTAAQTKHKHAKLRATASSESLSTAARAAEGLAGKLEDRQSQLDQVNSDVPANADLATLTAETEAAAALVQAVTSAETEVGEAEEHHDIAESRLRELNEEEARRRAGYTIARDSVAARTPPPPVGASLQADWVALAAWATTESVDAKGELEQIAARVEFIKGSTAEHLSAVSRACAPLDVDDDPDGLSDRLTTAVVEAQQTLDRAVATLETRTELEAKLTALREARALNTEMGNLLKVDGFERWLMEEALGSIVARATERLHELSAGQYSLEADDGAFFIRDHRNADERRDVRTLSGGETFLASLALALALADNVAEMAVEGAPQLDSMFLDEGFGTLDPETLDVVAGALEELGSSGRTIGIVTHIRELADRMPVRFEVSKDGQTARVQRVEV